MQYIQEPMESGIEHLFRSQHLYIDNLT